MNKIKHPVFAKSLFGLAFCFLLSVYLFYRAGKNKNDFYSVKGEVQYIEGTSPFYPNKNAKKHRYLKVSGYRKAFELFIGKESGDFTPKYEVVDKLKPGDTVTVYYDEGIIINKDPVNRLAYFIDRESEIIFIKGSWEKILAYVIAGLCITMLVVLWILKKKGRII